MVGKPTNSSQLDSLAAATISATLREGDVFNDTPESPTEAAQSIDTVNEPPLRSPPCGLANVLASPNHNIHREGSIQIYTTTVDLICAIPLYL